MIIQTDGIVGVQGPIGPTGLKGDKGDPGGVGLQKTYLGSMQSITGGAEFAVTTFDGRYSLRFFIPTNRTLDNTNIQIKHNGTVSSVNDNIIIMHTVMYNIGAHGNSESNFNVTGTYKDLGDLGVFYGGKPEYRELIFTPMDNTKRVYRYMFFFGAPSTAYAQYPNTKCWIYAEENFN